ncbi:MAG: hypothetical protein A2Y73_03120 [Chloroflexi bacterium RBG_13_56_8]|nr:MAG: hypothetical protein A2Y73_03120 [Chloroflexi bacterium RBG_13_56_8]
MARYRSRSKPAKNPLQTIAFFLKIVLLITLVGLAVLALSETPSVANWLAGLKPQSPLVGLIAGHWQSDSGAVCPDGLQEVELNLAITRRVATILRQRGYRVEVLPEYSPNLNDYRAMALLSIHCDSCIEELSGFKVARMTHSEDPQVEDALVQSLYQAYEQATGLKPHPNTITEDMRQYHALRRIAADTPGAIIECGFMGGDRYLLTNEQDRVAVGIVNGLTAFLRQQTATPSPEP